MRAEQLLIVSGKLGEVALVQGLSGDLRQGVDYRVGLFMRDYGPHEHLPVYGRGDCAALIERAQAVILLFFPVYAFCLHGLHFAHSGAAVHDELPH